MKKPPQPQIRVRGSNELHPSVDTSVDAADVDVCATNIRHRKPNAAAPRVTHNRLGGAGPQTCRVGTPTDTCFRAALAWSSVHRCRPERFPVDLLNRSHAGAELDRPAQRVKDDFQLGDSSKKVGDIEVAQVRDAEDLTLHRTLPVGDHRAELLSELLHNRGPSQYLKGTEGP